MEIRNWLSQHRFVMFLAGAIATAFVMVMISMQAYYASNAYQLDLSRPEYKAVREKISKTPKATEGFAAQGEITPAVLDDFLVKYREDTAPVLQNPAYSGDVLSGEQLGL